MFCEAGVYVRGITDLILVILHLNVSHLSICSFCCDFCTIKLFICSSLLKIMKKAYSSGEKIEWNAEIDWNWYLKQRSTVNSSSLLFIIFFLTGKWVCLNLFLCPTVCWVQGGESCSVAPILSQAHNRMCSSLILLWKDIFLGLVSWCFKPSQLQRIISGLRETFIKIYIVERTNKAEIRPEEQSGKVKSCWETLWNEIQLKGP